jgi:hypothetical protein
MRMLTAYDKVLMNLPGELFTRVMMMDNARTKTLDEIMQFKDRIITLFQQNYPYESNMERLMEELE